MLYRESITVKHKGFSLLAGIPVSSPQVELCFLDQFLHFIHLHTVKIEPWFDFRLIVVLFVFQVHDIEFAQIEIQVVQGLKSGNEALHKLHQVWIQQIHY